MCFEDWRVFLRVADYFHDVFSGWYGWYLPLVFVFRLFPLDFVNYGEVCVGFYHVLFVAVGYFQICYVELHGFWLVEVCVLADACQYVRCVS